MAKTTDIKFHRNGDVTLWNVLDQSWCRLPAARIGDGLLATLNDYERARIARHAAKSEVL